MAPADSPQRIMRELFPPKEPMYFLTQPRAARSARKKKIRIGLDEEEKEKGRRWSVRS
jgi:hypothetical protein